MAKPWADAVVHIKNSQGWAGKITMLAGFVCSLIAVLGMGSALHGDWNGLTLLIIPAIMMATVYVLRYLSNEDYAVLYPDRIELPGDRRDNRIVEWSEVKSISWPRKRRGDDSIYVQLILPNRNRLFCPRIDLGGMCASLSDRLTLIRYLRLAGASAEHENWPEFCRWCAVPLLEKHQRSESDSTAAGAETPTSSVVEAIISRFSTLAERKPFLAGMVSPVVIPPYLLMLVSRKAWWTLSVIVAISAAINVPLIWGWNAKALALMIGSPLALFILGWVAPTRASASQEQDKVPGGTIWVAVALIGMPLLGIAALHGWLPRQLACCVGPAFLLLLCVLPVLLARGQAGRRRERNAELESEALRRWATYESAPEDATE